MAKVNLNTIKNWFKTGLKPTQEQFFSTWDSFWHKDDEIPAANIADLDTYLAEKVDKETGKGLSTNDYTTTEKDKLTNLKAFKTITDGTSSFEAANAADSLTFDGAVVDPATRKIKVSSELSITDKNSIEKFVATTALSFGDGFSFDAILKRISYSPTSSLWQTGTLTGGGTGYFKYKRVDNRVMVRVSLSAYAETSGYEPYCNVGILPVGFRPDEEVTRAVFGYPGSVPWATAREMHPLGLRVFSWGHVILTLGDAGQAYTFDFEFPINTNDI